MDCFICKIEGTAVQEHHVLFEHVAGANSPTVPLCSTCHDTLHRVVTRRITALRSGKACNILEWPNLRHKDELARATRLVDLAMTALVSKGLANKELPVKMMLSIPPELNRALQEFQKQYNMSSKKEAVLSLISWAMRQFRI